MILQLERIENSVALKVNTGPYATWLPQSGSDIVSGVFEGLRSTI